MCIRDRCAWVRPSGSGSAADAPRAWVRPSGSGGRQLMPTALRPPAWRLTRPLPTRPGPFRRFARPASDERGATAPGLAIDAGSASAPGRASAPGSVSAPGS
eukprot:8029643-Alexandrium_andersonii.AAC.1